MYFVSVSVRFWATTPVDGIGFSVLERVHLELSQFKPSTDSGGAVVEGAADGDVQMPVQADLFGRHPSKGSLLVERVRSDD